jgi:hypothetical protein
MTIQSDSIGGGTAGSAPPSLFNQAKSKINNIHFSKQTWVLVVGACVVLIVERKINLKTKTIKIGGKK